MKICLDYGHGGSDSGAVFGSRLEKNDVLVAGRALRDRLRQHNFVVVETRSGDAYVGLSERAAIANAHHADYFISVHRNAGGGTGIESYLFTQTDSKTDEFGTVVHSAITGKGFADRGLKRANFAVLRETAMSAILVELGFIDNERDNSLYDVQAKELGVSIANAIGNWLGAYSPVPILKKHIVEKGDTLWGISARYGTTVEKLVEVNKLNNKNLIYIGQEILLP